MYKQQPVLFKGSAILASNFKTNMQNKVKWNSTLEIQWEKRTLDFMYSESGLNMKIM